MIFSNRLRTLLFTLALALLALWIINQQAPPNTHEQALLDSDTFYSWKSTNSLTWQIDRTQPNQQTTLETTEFRYHETNQKSDFTNPIIHLTQADSQIRIRSQYGQSVNNNLIHLNGNVVILQQALSSKISRDKKSNSSLHSEHITYNAKENRLYSRDNVTLKQPMGTTTATGFEANLETNRIQLLSNVQGTYYPNSSEN